MFQTHPIPLKTLLTDIKDGKIQLPDFQRGWVWDDDRIKGLLVSISRSFPIGALMTLSADGEVQFQKRPIEGVLANVDDALDRYLLDGQQRLTSLYQTLQYEGPVATRDRPGGKTVINRWYYVDMQKALNPDAEPEERIISVPENRIETRDFGRQTVIDLSHPEKEFHQHMIPTERIMDNTSWGFEYARYWDSCGEQHPRGNAFQYFMEFQNAVLNNFTQYQLPVINLDKDTSKEAVCTVFEKVNTGGVVLTVFELLTASLAANGFSLRDDWEARRRRLHQRYSVLRGILGTNFLQVISLLATQKRQRQVQAGQGRPPIGCRRAEILSVTLDEYREWADKVEQGFEAAAKFLHAQYVFTEWNVPYHTQLVPLAAIFVELGHEGERANTQALLERWYWSGVFGEMYGSAVETQFARDLAEVPEYVRRNAQPTSLRDANFDPNRLITLRTRLSAAYKGLYALQMKSGASDWLTGRRLTLDDWDGQNIDIHHIFPKRWCESEATPRIPQGLYNSIINKTPIDARTNRVIGGDAPSRYLPRLMQHNNEMETVLKSHWLNPELLQADRFSDCFVERGEAMLHLIYGAMGKPVTDGQQAFWSVLHSAGVADEPRVKVFQETDPSMDEMDDDEEFDYVGEAAAIGI